MTEHLDHQYNELIRPDNFIHQFKNMHEFEEWCYIGAIEDLECALKEFEKYELYEYCAVIKSVIKSLLDSKAVFESEF
jgi:hypothetical protein